MKEEVFQIQRYSGGYRVDRNLLLCLDEIFKQYKENYTLKLSVECANNTGYVFESIDGCFEVFDKNLYRIVKIEINAEFGETLNHNSLKLSFENIRYSSTFVFYKFDNNDDYLLIKNKIEQCLKNFKLNYWVLSRIPIVPILLTIVFYGICIYTNVYNIVFEMWIQILIGTIWLLYSLSEVLSKNTEAYR